jgi:hypothetical protein
VGNPNDNLSISYGTDNGIVGTIGFSLLGLLSPEFNPVTGGAYLDDAPGGQIEKYYKTTPQQDQAIIDYLRKDLKDSAEGPYNVFNLNCRTYSENRLDALVKKFGLTPSTPPVHR